MTKKEYLQAMIDHIETFKDRYNFLCVLSNTPNDRYFGDNTVLNNHYNHFLFSYNPISKELASLSREVNDLIRLHKPTLGEFGTELNTCLGGRWWQYGCRDYSTELVNDRKIQFLQHLITII